MGTYYEFHWPACRYTAEVSGEESFGYWTQTTTMICPDCVAVVDVITKTGISEAQELVGRCPVCQCAGVLPWDPDRKPCPKCGKGMEKGNLTAFWD